MQEIINKVTIGEYELFRQKVMERMHWNLEQYKNHKAGRTKTSPLELDVMYEILASMPSQQQKMYITMKPSVLYNGDNNSWYISVPLYMLCDITPLAFADELDKIEGVSFSRYDTYSCYTLVDNKVESRRVVVFVVKVREIMIFGEVQVFLLKELKRLLLKSVSAQ